MNQDKLQTFLLNKGSNPKKSTKFFMIGLMLFLAGVLLIYMGTVFHVILQIIGLIILIPAIFFAGKGYIGIISNRLAFFRHQAHKNKQRFKNIK